MSATLTLSRPLDRLTTERLEQAGVVQAQQADNTHRRTSQPMQKRSPGTAREAERLDAPAKLEATLRELAPAVFNDYPPPLAVGRGRSGR